MSEYKKKLIEVALPLEEINAACKADKDRKIGTIRNVHKWFAPMPLPAWRALIYAALIDDPGNDEQRAYHLDLIGRLVRGGADLPDAATLQEAQRNLEKQFPGGTPTVMDPFCGGGSTLVEAQRLGLNTFGSDLNPIPVLITRTLTDLLPKTFGMQPIHPEGYPGDLGEHAQDGFSSVLDGTVAIKIYAQYEGLAADVSYYAHLVRDRSWVKLRDCYEVRQGEIPIAWLWARTAKCTNPACQVETVLTTTWWLSKKQGDLAWINPRVEDGEVHLDVVKGQRVGEPPQASKSGRGAAFVCVACGSPITEAELFEQASNGQMGLRLTAILVEIDGKKQYRAPDKYDLAAAAVSVPMDGIPDNVPVSDGGTRKRFGLTSQADLYTPRQLISLMTFSDEVAEIYQQVIDDGGTPDWARVVVTLLGLGVGKIAHYGSSQTRIEFGHGGSNRTHPAFARNDIPMTWDFAEVNVFGDSSANWLQFMDTQSAAFRQLAHGSGTAERVDARIVAMQSPGLVATDPPYFDAISYADLSDYFYIWHRRALKRVHPDLYATVAAPKAGELTALPVHHNNSRADARTYFIDGFTETFHNLKASMLEGLPLLVVYASKEQRGGREEETRWSSILTAMVQAGLEITGTWPVHGTGSNRMVSQGANAVATYVVMVSRPRLESAGTCSLQDFNRALRRELKPAVHDLQAAGILPVDLAQAAMGPGMQVYSQYTAILDQTGAAVPVEMALRLINQALAEVLDEQEGELDADSRFAVTWWEQHHWSDAAFGEADQLARPYGISVDAVVRAGVASYPKPGFVRVEGNDHLIRDWEPSLDVRPTAWEAVHHLADRLIDGGGISEAGALMGKLGNLRDPSQGLVYRLHAIADRKGWTQDQERYNALIGSWSDLLAEAGRLHKEEGLF